MARSNVPNILGRGRGNGVTDASLTRRRVAAGRGSLGLALAVSCVALAACGGSSSSSSSAGGKTGVVNANPGGSLTVLLNSGYEGAWPTGLDPATNTNGAANQDLMNSIYGNLFELGQGVLPDPTPLRADRGAVEIVTAGAPGEVHVVGEGDAVRAGLRHWATGRLSP